MTTNGEIWSQLHPELRKVSGASRAARLAQPTKRKAKPVPLPLKPPERAGEVAIIPLPLPPPELQPNKKTKVNQYKLTKLIKATRNAAQFIAGQIRPPKPWERVLIDVRIYTTNRLDRDNIIGWIKHQVDGLQDAGLIVNDSEVTWGEVVRYAGLMAEGRREVELVVTKIDWLD